jgi:hypothetical protein
MVSGAPHSRSGGQNSSAAAWIQELAAQQLHREQEEARKRTLADQVLSRQALAQQEFRRQELAAQEAFLKREQQTAADSRRLSYAQKFRCGHRLEVWLAVEKEL